jgi:hypothetical protein
VSSFEQMLKGINLVLSPAGSQLRNASVTKLPSPPLAPVIRAILPSSVFMRIPLERSYPLGVLCAGFHRPDLGCTILNSRQRNRCDILLVIVLDTWSGDWAGKGNSWHDAP